MKINKKIIKELSDYLNEFNLTELEYTDKDTKIKVSKNSIQISNQSPSSNTHIDQSFKDKEDKILIGSTKKLKLKNKGKDVYIHTGNDLLAKVKGAKGDLSKKGKYLV